MRSVYPSSVSDGLEIYTEYSCTRSALCSSEYPVLWVSRNLNLKLKRQNPRITHSLLGISNILIRRPWYLLIMVTYYIASALELNYIYKKYLQINNCSISRVISCNSEDLISYGDKKYLPLYFINY